MKKQFSLLLLFAFFAISGYSFNKSLFFDPPVINPPIKKSATSILQNEVIINKVTNTNYQYVCVLKK